MTGPTGRARRVGLVFGGQSVEHEVSVTSARSVARALAEASLECIPIAVTGQGRWLTPELSRKLLEGPGSRAEPGPEQDDGCRVALDPGGTRLLRLAPDAPPRPVEVDVVFPLIHGWGGEDGRLQGALELLAVPYVGAGVLGSAAGMDKVVARRLFEAHQLPGVRWLDLTRHDWSRAPAAAHERVASSLGFPVFVKPANGGSSVGVTRVDDPAALAPALRTAFDCDRKVLVEQGLDAREIECAVLGNDEPEASVLGEIVPSRQFYDYEAKYVDGTSRLEIPAQLSPQLTAEIRDLALRAFRSLDLAGFARVDFLVQKDTLRVHLNEVNSLPGFTPISMFPRLWEASGLPYPRLVERIVALGLERWQGERGRRSRR